MEIAELASMSMELFTMEHWGVFFDSKEELQRAKTEELERVISVLPWIATIDKFQHWLYTNPGHSVEEREQEWMKILGEFSTGLVDWSGFDDYRRSFWQKQLHLFEVPFYYIEYGIAQLGALAMWRQYRGDREAALKNYQAALALGYTKGLKDLYSTAGIRFDFSPDYVAEIGGFVEERLAEVGITPAAPAPQKEKATTGPASGDAQPDMTVQDAAKISAARASVSGLPTSMNSDSVQS